MNMFDRRKSGESAPSGLTIGRRSFGALCLASLATGAGAAELRRPAASSILTISGKIRVTNEGETARFDRQMLEEIGMESFTTKTPWYDDPVTFEGPRMSKIMAAVEAYGETVTAVALNDYITPIPMSDFAQYGTLLALKRNGAYMPVRDKGPLFIVYPYDTDADLRHRRFYSRSAWQVARLVVS